MSNSTQKCSEAFRKLDAFMSAQADDCEEALEWVPLLTPDDWRRLESIWPERSADWRANCACIVGHFQCQETEAILRRTLADTNSLVASEAAVALCRQMITHPRIVRFDQGLVPRLKELLRGEGGHYLSEVRQVLREHGEAE